MVEKHIKRCFMEIYSIRISDIDETKLNELSNLIDFEKKLKLEKLRNKNDKIRTLIGELLLRRLIVNNFNIDNNQIQFYKNQYGKPYLKEYHEFNFNISHSGEYVIVVIDNMPVGTDIEEVKPIDYEGIAKDYLSAEEYGYILSQVLECRLDSFYEIWTLKESYMKCCGQGLSIPLKSFSVEIDQFENIVVVSEGEQKVHGFKLFDIDKRYKLAICSVKKEIESKIIKLDQNDLINEYLEFY